MNKEFECPNCGEWFEPIERALNICPSCKAEVMLDVDAEFDGVWRDLSKLILIGVPVRL